MELVSLLTFNPPKQKKPICKRPLGYPFWIKKKHTKTQNANETARSEGHK